MLIENHNKVNRNLIKNFWILFSAEKYFSRGGFKEMYLKTLLIENHNKVNRNLIKNFWIQFSAEKYFSRGI
jgi:hypothetical protein